MENEAKQERGCTQSIKLSSGGKQTLKNDYHL